MNYINFIGGLISVEFPFFLVMLCGWFFAKMSVLEKEGLVSFAKIMKELFLPCYLFLYVCQATSVLILTKFNIIIISQLIQVFVAAGLACCYIFYSNMDTRFRWTWLVILSIII